VSLLYADSSALLRAYFADEPDHAELRSLLLEGDQPVVTSELASVEIASAVRAAAHSSRRLRPAPLLARIEADCGPGGPVTLLRLRAETILPVARRLVLDHRLRTLDAIHLATALDDAQLLATDGHVVLVTRDGDQARAARALGLATR
jgi:hypothetical protein